VNAQSWDSQWIWLIIELGDRSVCAASPRKAVDEKIYREAIGYLDDCLLDCVGKFDDEGKLLGLG